MRPAMILALVLTVSSIAFSQPSTRTISEEYPDRLSTEVVYPRFYEKNPVCEAADKAINTWVTKAHTDFMSKAMRQLGKGAVPENKLESKVESDVTFYSPKKLISVTFDSYEYFNGENGVSTYKVFNFGDVRGKARQLVLGDLFKKGSDYKKSVSKLILQKLAEDQDATRVQSGEMKSLKDDQLNRFQVDSEGLTFLFDQGELASSDTRFKVKLLLEELSDFEWGKVLAE